MQLSRRAFLKTITAGTFALVSGIGLTDAIKRPPAITRPWSLDGKTINYTGPPDGSYSVLDLHRWLQELADDFDPNMNLNILSENPSSRCTDTIIQLHSGYTIDDSSAEHLYGGSIQDDLGNIWSGLQTVGEVSGGGKVTVLQDGDVVLRSESDMQGHIDALIKTRNNNQKIDGGRICVRCVSPDNSFTEFDIHEMSAGVNIAPVYFKTIIPGASTMRESYVEQYSMPEFENRNLEGFKFHFNPGKRKLDI